MQSRKFRLFSFGPVNSYKNDKKNDIIIYSFEKRQLHGMLSDFVDIKIVIEDILFLFFC